MIQTYISMRKFIPLDDVFQEAPPLPLWWQTVGIPDEETKRNQTEVKHNPRHPDLLSDWTLSLFLVYIQNCHVTFMGV